MMLGNVKLHISGGKIISFHFKVVDFICPIPF